MIPSPDTLRESAECCLAVLQIVPLENARMAHIFVDALETYLHDSWSSEGPQPPADPDGEEAFNRLVNRTWGFVRHSACRDAERAGRMREILRLMREDIDKGDGADRLYDALSTIEDGGRDKGNAMLQLIRGLRRI